ncbi:MAG: hypothetical protein IPM39_25515 [Chloroflexi bacterium]|nr:hypothetical protein [Chloroflexota bacterium]
MSAHHSRHDKVIGYFAYESPTRVVCTGAACVIAGSRRAMQQYLLEIDPQQRPHRTIQKTTFAEIKRGLELGAAYALTKQPINGFIRWPEEPDWACRKQITQTLPNTKRP